MRYDIHHLRSNDLPWRWLSDGVYRKVLNGNEHSKDMTALFRFVAQEGALAPDPTLLHSHLGYQASTAYTESKQWIQYNGIGDCDYVYHPYSQYYSEQPTADTTVFIRRVNNTLGEQIGRKVSLHLEHHVGAGTQLIRLKAGSKVMAKPSGYPTCNEGFIISGSIIAGDGTEWRTGDYWHRYPNTPVPALSVLQDTLILNVLGNNYDAA